MKRSLKVKLEMAKFLQKTLDEMSVQHSDHFSQEAKEFKEWFNKVRTSGKILHVTCNKKMPTKNQIKRDIGL